VAVQKNDCPPMSKGASAGSAGLVREGSMRLVSSEIDGIRQPICPPVLAFRHSYCADGHERVSCWGVRSQTRPVFLSSTDSLLNAASTTNRSDAGKAALQLRDTSPNEFSTSRTRCSGLEPLSGAAPGTAVMPRPRIATSPRPVNVFRRITIYLHERSNEVIGIGSVNPSRPVAGRP